MDKQKIPEELLAGEEAVAREAREFWAGACADTEKDTPHVASMAGQSALAQSIATTMRNIGRGYEPDDDWPRRKAIIDCDPHGTRMLLLSHAWRSFPPDGRKGNLFAMTPGSLADSVARARYDDLMDICCADVGNAIADELKSRKSDEMLLRLYTAPGKCLGIVVDPDDGSIAIVWKPVGPRRKKGGTT
jgi:hypothetical protein